MENDFCKYVSWFGIVRFFRIGNTFKYYVYTKKQFYCKLRKIVLIKITYI